MQRTTLTGQLTTLLSLAQDPEASYATSVIGEQGVEYQFGLSVPEKRQKLVTQLQGAIDYTNNDKHEIAYFTLWNIKFEVNLVSHNKPVPSHVLDNMKKDAKWLIIDDKISRLKHVVGSKRIEDIPRTTYFAEKEALPFEPHEFTPLQAELNASSLMDKYNLPYYDAKTMVTVIAEIVAGVPFKRAYSRRFMQLINIRKETGYTNMTGNYTVDYLKSNADTRASKTVVATSEADACATLKQLLPSATNITVTLAS